MNSGCLDTALPSGVAVDLGGTKLAAARVTSGQVGEVLKVRTDGAGDAEHQITAICNLLQELELQPDERVGVALSGRVSRGGVWHAVNTGTLSGFTSVPIKEILSERLGRDVNVENDATAGAIGEYIVGSGRGVGSFGFITVSTGVGGGVVLNGRPLVSDNGLAGHIGFTTSRLANAVCGSGRLGTVESVAGGRAIAALAGRADFDAKAVFDAHLAGQDWASQLIVTSANAIAELSANLAAIFGVERVAIGGSIGLASGYLDLVRAGLSNEPDLFRTEVVPTMLGSNSAFVGILVQVR